MIRRFALVFGLLYLAAGIAGFIPAFLASPGNAPPLAIEMAHGNLLGLFPVNAVHNLVHLAIGLWGVAAFSHARRWPILFARSLAVLYGLLAVLGIIPATATLFGLAPLYGHDIWLHALSALLATYFGFIVPEEVRMTARPD